MLQRVSPLYNKQLDAPTHFWEGTCSAPSTSATGYSYSVKPYPVVLWANADSVSSVTQLVPVLPSRPINCIVKIGK